MATATKTRTRTAKKGQLVRLGRKPFQPFHVYKRGQLRPDQMPNGELCEWNRNHPGKDFLIRTSADLFDAARKQWGDSFMSYARGLTTLGPCLDAVGLPRPTTAVEFAYSPTDSRSIDLYHFANYCTHAANLMGHSFPVHHIPAHWQKWGRSLDQHRITRTNPFSPPNKFDVTAWLVFADFLNDQGEDMAAELARLLVNKIA